MQKLILGSEIAGLGQSQVEIAAVLIYNRALAETERLQIEDFLQNLYISDSGNIAPVAEDDYFTMDEDTLLFGNVTFDNGAGPDSDVDDDPLTAKVVTEPPAGNLTLNADGSFSYVPDAHFNGEINFTYEIADGRGEIDQATVTITIAATPDIAEAIDDQYYMARDTALVVDTAAGVKSNDFHPDGDPFDVFLTVPASNGSVSLVADGGFTYTPSAGFTGADSFTYQATGGDTATVKVNVGGSGIPVLSGLVASYSADENVSLGSGSNVVGWLDGSGRGNDLVAQGNPIFEEGATATGASAIAFDGAGDILIRDGASDSLNGLPSGSADRTIFAVVDYVDTQNVTAGVVYGNGAPNEAFGLTANSKNDSAQLQGWGASNDFASGFDAVAGAFFVQSAVLDSNTFSLYQNGFLIESNSHVFNTDPQSIMMGGEIAGLGESALYLAAVLIYDRALSEAERLDVEAYLQATYIADLNNTAPTAADDVFAVAEDTLLTGNVLADNSNGEDNDPDGDSLNTDLVTGVTNGTLMLNGDGTFDYEPDADFFGADNFVYEVNDGRGGASLATALINVAAVDDPAVAVDDNYSTLADVGIVIDAAAGVLANDGDAEGDPFSATLLTDVSDGTLALTTDGSFTYTPSPSFIGLDSFSYSVTGGDTATVTLAVGQTGFPVIIGLVAAFEVSDVILGVGSNVTGWTDSSGLVNDLFAS